MYTYVDTSTQVFQSAVTKRVSQLEKDTTRKASGAYKTQCNSSKYTFTSTSQHHYGPNLQQSDASLDELDRLCHEYFEREVRVTDEQIRTIEVATQQQSESPEW